MKWISGAILLVLLLSTQYAIAQGPSISSLTLDATSAEELTNDSLICTYSSNPFVVETASAWYKNGSPLAVLYLPFEGGATNALLDFSGRGNHLTLSGNPDEAPTWDPSGGYNGNGAFSFDGGDYMTAGEIFPLNSSYTKAAWINITGSGFRNIMSSASDSVQDHHFKVNPDGALSAGHSYGASIVRSPDSLFHDQWYFVAVSFDFGTGEMILYKNGAKVDRGIVPDSLRSILDASVLIGARDYNWGWMGLIDEPRIYNHVLSLEQIKALYAGHKDMIMPSETRPNDQWYVEVTPFSTSEVGSSVSSSTIGLQGPAVISDVALNASSPDNLTIDNLITTFTSSEAVVETAITWFRDGNPDGLLYLPFEGGYANALVDYSGNDNPVTYNVNLATQPAWMLGTGYNGGSAFSFDGDDYLQAGNILPLNSSYTKTAWVNLSGSGFRNIMSSVLYGDNNHHFKVNSDGRLNAGHSFGTAIVTDSDPLNLGQYYFVVVTFDYESGEMILYKDGVEIDNGIVPPALRSVADPSVLIGAMANNYEWVGLIDEPRIYDRVLSAEQIQALYASGNSVIASQETSGLEEWYVEVTSFSFSEVGNTLTSNTLTVHSVEVSDIPDQTIQEGSSFIDIALDDYVNDYEYTDNDISWAVSGNADLSVFISSSNLATITIPGINWYGIETITFTATNPKGDFGAAEATFSVVNVNDAPVLSEVGVQSVDEDQSLIGLPVVFSDLDPTDTHLIEVISDEANVLVDNLSGNISGSTYDLIPAADWNGTAQITVTVTDNGTGAYSDSETYILSVNSVNDAPVLSELGDQTTEEDTGLTGLAVVFNDVDVSNSHIIEVVSSESSVEVANLVGNTSGSTYDLIPATDWNGTAQITVTVTDNGAGNLSDVETYTLTVSPVNDAPVLNEIGNQSMDEDTELTGLAVVFTDADASDTHTIEVLSSEPNVVVGNLTGNVSGSTYDLIPVSDWNGTAQITVAVTDNGVGSLSNVETYTLTVIEIDDTPVLTEIGDQTTSEDTPIMGLAVVYTYPDVDDTHVLDIVSDNANLTVANLSGDASGSTYDLIPASNWHGTAQISVTVTQNGSQLSDSEHYTLTVIPVNDVPDDILLSNNTVDERVLQGSIIGQFSTSDVDAGDTHQYSFAIDGGINDVDNSSFTIDGDTLKTNTEIDYEVKNTYSLLVQSDDGNGGTIVRSFTVNVNDVDETSVFDLQSETSFELYPVPANDFVTVEIDNPENQELNVSFFNSSGVMVHNEEIFTKKRINLSEFTDGIYIVRIVGERVYGTRKLAIKR